MDQTVGVRPSRPQAIRDEAPARPASAGDAGPGGGRPTALSTLGVGIRKAGVFADAAGVREEFCRALLVLGGTFARRGLPFVCFSHGAGSGPVG
ncbi:hypothetical protein GCM10010269_56080 [Streptomyces humidus]|uniref:Uncharacterized protein n=1 Tax=Streptomyces humidus TaxID=52259 RepID=A0A918L5J7_9ACTN|nr:hypothetical protein GCM10010269_56080 [Streptomyces humidus]